MTRYGRRDHRSLRHDPSDLQRLIHYVQRRAELLVATGGALDRRLAVATILLGKLWPATLDLRLRGARLALCYPYPNKTTAAPGAAGWCGHNDRCACAPLRC